MKLTTSQFLKKHQAALLEILFSAIRWPAPARVEADCVILQALTVDQGDNAAARSLQTLLAQPGLRLKLDENSKYSWHCELGGVEFVANLTSRKFDLIELHVVCSSASQCARAAAALDIDKTERRRKQSAALELEAALLARLAVAFNEGQHFGAHVFADEVVVAAAGAALITSPIVPANLCEHFHRKGVLLRATRKPSKHPGALEGKIENIKFRMSPQDDQTYLVTLRGSSRV